MTLNRTEKLLTISLIIGVFNLVMLIVNIINKVY
jgi:hypothetical protein